MSDLKFNGVSVGYRSSGEGPTLLYLHSGVASGGQWRGVIEALEKPWRHVTVDFYGCGKTAPWPGIPEERTHEAEADLAMAVLEHLDLNTAPFHLVGHSYGGGIALRLAIAHSRKVAGMALIEPMAMSLLGESPSRENTRHHETLRDEALAFERLVAAGREEDAWRRFLDFPNGAGAWDALTPEARERFLTLTANVVSGLHANQNHATTPDECRTINFPVLALRGEKTLPAFHRITEVVAEAIPGCHLGTLAGAGHMSPLTHPALVAAAIEAHLGK